MNKHKRKKQLRVRSARAGKIIGLILIMFGLAWLLMETKKFLKTDSLFQIENISFECDSLRNHPEVREILNSDYNLNLFGFNLSRLKKKLEKIPQVREVIIRRRFPNIVEIKIEERKPVFILNREVSFYGIDKDGGIFPQVKGTFRWDLPVITGRDKDALEISIGGNKVSPEICLALKIASYMETNRTIPWELSEIHFGKFDEIYLYTFDPRLELRLTEGNLERGFENLSLVLADLGRPLALVGSIDLRFQEKVFVHLKG
ncbi:MAG: FtsQ-type POTRA domain-containing protein [Candidatus Ratteibacteria bacterium]|nr:FtsQ-type POTRA domain-containing protein [Candidatus Ratteibacteria bacterium]